MIRGYSFRGSLPKGITMKHLVFVYGTLKNGHLRSSVLQNERYLGIARTVSKYAMYQYGGYPALVSSPEENNHPITGELYEVGDEMMVRLDEIEGTAVGLFQRGEVALDEVNLTQLPLSENCWTWINSKKAVAYIFRDADKLKGARNCHSFWGLK